MTHHDSIFEVVNASIVRRYICGSIEDISHKVPFRVSFVMLGQRQTGDDRVLEWVRT